MGTWVTSDYKDTPAAAIPGLASNELADVEAKKEELRRIVRAWIEMKS